MGRRLSFISVYIKEGVDQHGLTLYHCICVEGAVHNPIRHNFAALNASPELADALIADFHHHHNFNCGSLHKHGKRYAGHYDPWLDHDLHKLREDIPWISKPAHQLIGPDTNPLDFSPTSEKFGIAMISSDTQINCNFMGSDLQIQPSIQPVYTTKLHLFKLCGSQKDVYTFLSKAKKQSLQLHLFTPKRNLNCFPRQFHLGATGVQETSHNLNKWHTQAGGLEMLMAKLYFISCQSICQHTMQSFLRKDRRGKP